MPIRQRHLSRSSSLPRRRTWLGQELIFSTCLGPEERLPKGRPVRALLFFVLMALIFPYGSATAGTLRCGSYLVQEGDDAFSVLARCGEPTQRMTITEPIYASSADGGTYPTDLVGYTQVWRYDRGSMSFPVIIKIADGVVQSIRFVLSPRAH